uniref:Galectin n=1 Tax=Sinocyclocheilus grahami TaxID=75366 RepID=A0A672P3M1_SINGR
NSSPPQKKSLIIYSPPSHPRCIVVPFSCMIKGGLQDGMSITVCGQVLPNADRFHVNLQHGSDVVALQVNPRYQMLWVGPAYVVHNTHQNGAWGWEERKYETPFPRGQMFSLQILVTKESYKILANGKPFSEYKHRFPFSNVDRICVVGMVELSFVTFHYFAVRNTNFKKINLLITTLIHNQTVPYKTIIHGGAQPGKGIIIQGVISPQAKRVLFSLRHRTGIAFDYSFCFDENVAVCNSYKDGKWGNEEQSGLKLFERGWTMCLTYCIDILQNMLTFLSLAAQTSTEHCLESRPQRRQESSAFIDLFTVHCCCHTDLR